MEWVETPRAEAYTHLVPSPHAPSPDYLISQIMPSQEVHLLAGPSGVGKSNFLNYMLPAWSQGGELWGFQCHPVPLVVVSCDRSEASVRRNLRRHGLTNPWPIIPARKIPGTDRFRSVVDHVHVHHPEVRLVVVEGLGSLVPDGRISDYSVVAGFLERAQFYCESYDLTILGTLHATKVKESDKFPSPRQRILGSVAWAGFSDLVIIMDPEDPEDVKNTNRIVHVLPRDTAEFKVKMSIASGVLKTVDDEAEAELESLLDTELAKVPPDREIPFKEILRWAFNLSISRTTCTRWIDIQLELGGLRRIRRGMYARISAA